MEETSDMNAENHPLPAEDELSCSQNERHFQQELSDKTLGNDTPIEPLYGREMEVIVKFQTTKKKEPETKSLFIPELTTIGDMKRRLLETDFWVKTQETLRIAPPENSTSTRFLLKISREGKELGPDEAFLISHPSFANLAKHIHRQREKGGHLYIYLFLIIQLDIRIELTANTGSASGSESPLFEESVLSFSVLHTDSVTDLKKKIEEETGVITERLHLLWKGRELHNGTKRLLHVAKGLGKEGNLQIWANEWVIHVRQKGLARTLAVDSSDTLKTLKSKISNKRDYALILCGGPLLSGLDVGESKDGTSLSNLGIKHGSVLYQFSRGISSPTPKAQCLIPKPEHRGISLVQLRHIAFEILKRCRREGWRSVNPAHEGKLLQPEDVTLYDLMQYFILPATEDRKCSYAELVADTEVDQLPIYFVSHWWGESVLQFITCLERHAYDRKLTETAPYWICAYALNQHDMSGELHGGGDPKKSPFYRAMQLPSCKGTVSVLDRYATCFSRIWCTFEIAVVHDLKDSAAVVENNMDDFLHDIYTIARGANGRCDQPVGLTDGVAASDGVTPHDLPLVCKTLKPNDKRFLDRMKKYAKAKHDRQSSFPLGVCLTAMSVELQHAEATQAHDKKLILNSIVGNLDDIALNPPKFHKAYNLLNATLRAKFAEAVYRVALDKVQVDKTMLEAFHKALAAAPYSHLAMSFAACSNFQSEAKDFMQALPFGLEKLELDLSGIYFQKADEFAVGMERLPKLKSVYLSLRNCRVLDNLGRLWDELAKLQAVGRLRIDLAYCTTLSNLHGVEKLFIATPVLLSLTLDFQGCRRLTSLQPLSIGLSHARNLKWLKLTCWIHDSKSLVGFDTALACLPNLLHLTFTISNCDDISLKRIAQGVGHLKGLTLLKIFFLVSDLSCINQFGVALSHLRHLTHLDAQCIGCKKISTIGAVSNGWKNSLRMDKLVLNFNGCSGLTSIQEIGFGIKAVKSLRTLRLHFRECPILSIQELADCLGSTSLEMVEELSLRFSENENLSLPNFEFISSKRLPRIKSLQLRFNSCQGVSNLSGLATLFRSIPKNQLDHLVLSFVGTKVSYECSMEVLRALAECQDGLTTLSIDLPGAQSMANMSSIRNLLQEV